MVLAQLHTCQGLGLQVSIFVVVTTPECCKCPPSSVCVMRQNLTSKRVNTIPQGHACQTRPTTTFKVVADKRVKKTQQVHHAYFSEAT